MIDTGDFSRATMSAFCSSTGWALASGFSITLTVVGGFFEHQAGDGLAVVGGEDPGLELFVDANRRIEHLAQNVDRLQLGIQLCEVGPELVADVIQRWQATQLATVNICLPLPYERPLVMPSIAGG